jgi:hypothetical protein
VKLYVDSNSPSSAIGNEPLIASELINKVLFSNVDLEVHTESGDINALMPLYNSEVIERSNSDEFMLDV